MNTDYALLLNTVLSESGCADASLQHTAETVPLVYRTLAEHNYYLLYVVSVVKALLHEDDAAFAHLARAQAQRQQAGAETMSTPAQPQLLPDVTIKSSSTLPPLVPSDRLDMQLTIIGGGTHCELMLRLICGCGGGTGIFSSPATRDPLVHPSHITVITRQPERLAPYAELGVHCLARHHGRHAVAQSDVVVLACPPAQLQEVVRDLFASAATETTTSTGLTENRAAVTASLPSLPNTAAAIHLLRPNTVLLSCMAGVPARRVTQAFQHSHVNLTFIPSLHTFGAHAPSTAPLCDSVNEPSTTASSSACSLPKGPPLPIDVATTPEKCNEGLNARSLEEAGRCFTVAMAAYRSARIVEMRSSSSFLRPAVLQQAATSAAAEAATLWREPQLPGGRLNLPGAAPPRLTDFTAGRHPSTWPTLVEYVHLWRVLKAYVQATFAEEAMKLACGRGGGGGCPRRRSNTGVGGSYGGLVSVVLPHAASKHHRMSEPGEVEAELLPALVLLPAAQTRVLWDAWWGNSGHSALTAGGDAALSLPPSVTDVTGAWLSRVYTSAAALKASLDDQFGHVLGSHTR